MSQLYLHIFKITLWVVTKDSGNLFSERAVTLEFNRGQYCAPLMVCYNSNSKKWFGGDCPCMLISLRSFPFSEQQRIQKATDVSSSMPPKWDYWRSSSWFCSNARLSCRRPGKGYCESLFSASDDFALSMQESHCFNYIHVITSINCNVFVCVWVTACVCDMPCYVNGKLLKKKEKKMTKLKLCSMLSAWWQERSSDR